MRSVRTELRSQSLVRPGRCSEAGRYTALTEGYWAMWFGQAGEGVGGLLRRTRWVVVYGAEGVCAATNSFSTSGFRGIQMPFAKH